MSFARKYYIEQQVSAGKPKVEIIGLVHSSTFDGYHMVLEDRCAACAAQLFFPCDHVAKSLVVVRTGQQQEDKVTYVTALQVVEKKRKA